MSAAHIRYIVISYIILKLRSLQCAHSARTQRPEQGFKCLLLTYTLGFHHLGCQRLMRHHLIGQNDPGWNYGCHQNHRLPYSPLSVCDVEDITLV